MIEDRAMPELHQIVDQIRGIVQSNDQTRSALIDRLSSAYAQACGEVNQRLGRCHRLLQQGLRSEAIQLAESEPKLLDASAVLDFPERSAWDELVAIYNLTPAPRIQVDAAQFLNQAYAEQEPLADLLRNHRRLALQRAPLRSRIAVIRQLAAQDANNLIWVDDLRTFEQARFREIQDEAAQAVQAREAGRLAKLIEELQGQAWSEPPPKALLPRLAKADAELRGQQTRTALAEVEGRLGEAFNARDPILGRSARNTWVKIASTTALGPDDPIRKRVQPVLDWLEELDRIDQAERDYNDAHGELVRLLDQRGHVSPRSLECAARTVLDFGRGMAEDLQRRYVARMQIEEMNQKRRFWIVVGASAAAIIVVAGLSQSLVQGMLRAEKADNLAARIEKLINPRERSDASLKEAWELVAAIKKDDPELLTHSRLSEAQEELRRLFQREQERNAEFERGLLQFSAADLAMADAPIVKRLEELAGNDPAKGERIEQIASKRGQDRVIAARRAAEKVGPLLEQAETGIDRARECIETGAGNIAAIDGYLDQARRSLREAFSSVDTAGGRYKAREKELRDQLEAEERNLGTVKRRLTVAQQISDTLANGAGGEKAMMVRFARRLTDYVNAFPDDPQSAEMKRSLSDESSIWNAIDAWNALADRWRNDAGGLTSQAAERAAQCKQFLGQHPSFPDAADIAAYQRHAEAISLRGSTKEGPRNALKKLFEHPSIDQVYMLAVSELQNGKPTTKRYYGPKPGQPGDVRFEHYTSPNLGPLVSRKFDRDNGEIPVPAPQSNLADRVKPRLLDQANLRNWEGFVIGLFDEIVQGQDGIDPILQVQLLRSVLRLGSEGSEPMRELKRIVDLQQELDQAEKRVRCNWMVPEDRGVDQAREDARNVLRSLNLRKLEKLRTSIDETRRRIESSVHRVYLCVGWLSRDGSRWELRKAPQTRASGPLRVPVAKQSDGEWKPAGSIVNGQEKLPPDGDPALAAGRPVFVKVDL